MIGRRELIQLIATGRVTPAEAERLLAVWNEGRETFLVLLACLVMALLAQANASMPWLLQVIKWSVTALFEALRHAHST